jgi:hypothetical protein
MRHLQPHRLLSLPLRAFHPSRPLRPPLPSFPSQNRQRETSPQAGSTKGEEDETEEPQAVAAATTNLNSAKAEAKLVRALDYLVAINDNSDNPVQKWVINESIQSLPCRLFQAADKKIL